MKTQTEQTAEIIAEVQLGRTISVGPFLTGTVVAHGLMEVRWLGSINPALFAIGETYASAHNVLGLVSVALQDPEGVNAFVAAAHDYAVTKKYQSLKQPGTEESS